MSASVVELQEMITVCLKRLDMLDMCINVTKSACIRVGNRCSKVCAGLATNSGIIPWVETLNYLGVTFVSGIKLRISLEKNRNKFYRSLNSILGKIGIDNPISVSLSLIASRCLPCLTYGLEAIVLTKSESVRIEHPFTRSFMKLFKTFNNDTVKSCQFYSGYLPVNYLIDINKINFLRKINAHYFTNTLTFIRKFLYDSSDLDQLYLKYCLCHGDSLAKCRMKIWKHFEAVVKL